MSIIFIISVNFPLLGAVLLLLLLSLSLLLFLWIFCWGQFYYSYYYLCEPSSVGSIFIITVAVFAIITISADLPLLGALVYDLFAFSEE